MHISLVGELAEDKALIANIQEQSVGSSHIQHHLFLLENATRNGV